MEQKGDVERVPFLQCKLCNIVAGRGCYISRLHHALEVCRRIHRQSVKLIDLYDAALTSNTRSIVARPRSASISRQV